MNKRYMTIVAMATLFFSTSIYATQWTLDPHHSQLHFVSVKKNTVAEVHQFKSIKGQYNEDGKVQVTIDLSSVDTHIPIRDKRIKKYLFQTDEYSTAILSAAIEPETIDAIAEGASKELTIDAKLSLHGQSKPLQIDVIISRLVGAKLSVVSVKPVIVNAGDFALVAGIDKLMTLAKLPSISQAVPVTFYLTFNLKRD